jgi:hypothetical protein
MSDGYPLFDKKHKNVSAKPSNPSIESLGEMRKELRTKRMPNGDFLNLPLKYIAVPPDLETITEQFLSQNIVPTKPMDTNPFGGGKLTLICDPRLTQDGPNYSWYGFSSTEYIDLIQISYLNGQTGIQLSTKMGFEVDGMDFKVLHDFGAGVVSTYGMFRNS